MEQKSHSETRFGLKKKVLEEITILAEEHKLQKVILFGSRARGDYRRASDIDLAVKGGNISMFSLDIEEKVPTLLTFDVVDLSNNISDELMESIEKEGIVLYEAV